MKTRLLVVASLLTSLNGLLADAVDASWTSRDAITKTANATLGPAAISVTNITNPSIGTADFSTVEYSAAPLPAGSSALGNYAVGSNYTATFSLPVSGLLIYAQFWNGNVGGTSPITYTFSQPFEILSGFGAATVIGNTLSLPAFQSGIIRFKNPVSTLSVAMNTSNTGGQIMSFGVVPKTATIAVTGTSKPKTKAKAYTLRGTADATYGIKSVTLKVGKKTLKAKGTANWSCRVKLAGKKTKVLIQAIANSGEKTAISRVTITKK